MRRLWFELRWLVGVALAFHVIDRLMSAVARREALRIVAAMFGVAAGAPSTPAAAPRSRRDRNPGADARATERSSRDLP